MPKTLPVTQSPSFPVAQGTYERFFPEKKPGGGPHEYCFESTYSENTVGYIIESPASHIAMPTDPPARDWIRFQQLALVWKSERTATSLVTDIIIHPAYQKIIGMGEKAIPFIIAALRSEGDEPDHWFWALRVLTGENPVEARDQGNLVGMAKAWIRWAEIEGYAR